MGLTDKEQAAAEFAALLYAHQPCTDYDGCTCSHQTGYEGTDPGSYSAWVVHVLAHYVYPELADSSRGLLFAPDGQAHRPAPLSEFQRAALENYHRNNSDSPIKAWARIAEERMAAPALLAALGELGREYGPLGVALVAARLTDPAVLVAELAKGPGDRQEPLPDGGGVTDDTLRVLTADNVSLSAVRNADPAAEADTRPVGNPVTLPVVNGVPVPPELKCQCRQRVIGADGLAGADGCHGDTHQFATGARGERCQCGRKRMGGRGILHDTPPEVDGGTLYDVPPTGPTCGGGDSHTWPNVLDSKTCQCGAYTVHTDGTMLPAAEVNRRVDAAPDDPPRGD